MIRALSIHSPWWWFIVHGYKPVENRSRPFNFRGPLAIHASKWWKEREVADDLVYISRFYRGTLPTLQQLRAQAGSIVGQVRAHGSVQAMVSPWFMGPYGIMLHDPIAYDQPVPTRGHQGIWFLPPDVEAAIRQIGQFNE